MRIVIDHTTRLAFSEPVREHQCELRLEPREDAAQRLLAFELTLEPEADLRAYRDSFGNRVRHFSLLAPHDALAVRVRAEVETTLVNPFDWVPLAPAEERGWLAARLGEEPALLDFVLHRSDAVPDGATLPRELAFPERNPARPLVENVQRAMVWARERCRWEPGATEVHAPLADFLARGAGVCQDFAHLLVAVVRGWGFPARYVMGYADPGALGQEEQATHAWAEVWMPGAGWRGFDATAGLVANDCYVAVAVGRDSRDAAPVRGTFKGDPASLPPEVSLRVARAEQECAAQ